MRMYDIILKKRGGQPLSPEEIAFFVDGYTKGDIPDYQAAALLMAIYFKGMKDWETAVLTDCMMRSGDTADLSEIPGVKVDKHSTGGVGDKTSLVIGPIVAACGVPVAKMSGRGLGHTGGTIDKLESIPGFRVELSRREFLDTVKRVGLSIIGQSENIAPADKKLYALRDVTATVDSLPLIASSVMSKKLASGADAILLDVKTGSGAFMKTQEDSIALAKAMVAIGQHNGKRMAALVTNMDLPLGYAIGNALEVKEAAETLRGHGPADLTALCLQLASEMLALAGKGDPESCMELARQAVESGRAFETFRAMAAAQGGDVSVLDDLEKFAKAPCAVQVAAPQEGWICRMQTEQCGIASMLLGAGRKSKGDPIDYSAGIRLYKKTGDFVRAGEPIACLFTSRPGAVPEAKEALLAAICFSKEQPAPEKLVYARITPEGVTRI